MEKETMIQLREWVEKDLILEGYEHGIILAKIDEILNTPKQPDKVVMNAEEWYSLMSNLDTQEGKEWINKALNDGFMFVVAEYGKYVLSEHGLDKAITLLEYVRTELLFHSGTSKIIESIETFLTNYKQSKK